eukprot:4135210-Pyramimonas_sp.AAC.2
MQLGYEEQTRQIAVPLYTPVAERSQRCAPSEPFTADHRLGLTGMPSPNRSVNDSVAQLSAKFNPRAHERPAD